MISRKRQKVELNWKLIVKVPYKILKNSELELVVAKDDDGYEADDSDSDTCSTSSRDTVIYMTGKVQYHMHCNCVNCLAYMSNVLYSKVTSLLCP